MSLRDTFAKWDLLNRFAAWTGYFSALMITASTACMLVAFGSGHIGWGLVAAAAIAVELCVGSAVVGGVSAYDRHIHHETPHLL